MLILRTEQVGKFMLAKPGERVIYENNQELYWHIGENDVSEDDVRPLHADIMPLDPTTMAYAEHVQRQRC